MAADGGKLAWLGENAAKLFLVGAALYAVFVANQVLTTYTGTSYWFASTFAWAAWILVPLGVLGLYPALVERRPYLSRAAAVVTVIPVLCSAIVFTGEIVEAAGILSEAPGVLALTPFVGIVTFYVALALFGVTVLIADVHPKAVGVLMLVIASLFPLDRTVLSGLPGFVPNGVELVAILAIGLVLLTEGVPTDEARTPAGPTP